MPPNFGQVRPGDPLQIPALIWNDLLAMRTQWRNGRQEIGGGGGSVYDRTAHVEFVCQDDDLTIGQAVWLEEPYETVSPPDAGELDHATRRFVARPIFKGKKVADGDVTVGSETVPRQVGIVVGMANRQPGAQANRIGVAAVAGCVVAYMLEAGDGQWIKPGDGGCVYSDEGFAQVVWPQDPADRSDIPHLAFVRITGGAPADTDCPEYDCGLAVGAALPRSTSTGVLRMFRGQRPNTNAALSTTNRPEKEIQLSVGFLGRWPSAKTARLMLPGMPYTVLAEPDPNVNADTTSGYVGINGSQQTDLRRHLVTRRYTPNKNAIEMDWTPPGVQSWIYLLGHDQSDVTVTGGGTQITSFGPRHLAMRVYDGIIVGGRWFQHSAGGNITWATGLAPLALSIEEDFEAMETYFDGGCCPKYDAVSTPDIYQGPGGFA